MSTLDRSELNVLRAILTTTTRSDRALGKVSVELDKLKGAVIARHIGETLDDMGHPRPAEDDALGQAIDRASDKIAIALALAVATDSDRGRSLTGTISAAIYKRITQFDDDGIPPSPDETE